MREILFRGKGDPDLNEGGWYYGYLRQDKDGDYQICGDCWARTVIPETIGQCTELKDKNGTKIFEGDIVDFSARSDGDGYGVVKYDANETEFGIEYDNIYEGLGRHYYPDDIEVIGNIYDNPELLKGEK